MQSLLRALSPWLLTILLVGSAGCSGRMVGSGDAGADGGSTPTLDGSTDAAAPVDAGPPDAGMATDAGPPDGGPPPCACPTFPTTCAPPAVNAPAFTPDATDMASQLFDVIACADTTLQIAIYEWEWDCVRDAVQAALDRDADLVVEIVVDDGNCPPGDCYAETLTPPERVHLERDDRLGSLQMHHKYVIADGERLWVGSANFTRNSFCYEHNNSVVIEDTLMVGRYAAVFERMFTDGVYGPVAPEEPTVSGSHTAYFGPESPIADDPQWLGAMLTAINEAPSGTRIDVMINAWTLTEVSDALIAAHTDSARGVTVRALVSHLYASGQPAQDLLEAGIDIRRGPIHDKVMILDTTVITGSANWSVNARRNNENSLWMYDPSTVSAYRAEFESVFADADAVTPL